MDDHQPGFRFYPTEEELVAFYLYKKLEGSRQDLNRVIPAVDIYEFNPWELPRLAGERCQGDEEQWFFFIPRQEKEARGERPNRLTASGYWKATGSPGNVYSSDNRVIGRKRTMVFYRGRAPSGRKTEWKMNEYKAIDQGQQASSSSTSTAIPKLRQEFSVCRVYKTSSALRAFDRRPSGVIDEAAGSVAVHQLGHGNEMITTSDHQNQPIMMEQTSSPDTSSFGDQQRPTSSQTMGNDNWNIMSVDNYTLWDWDQLDCFDNIYMYLGEDLKST